MKPLTVALDILQGEENCFHGTLLPTIETLMLKTEALQSGLQILRDFPDAIVTAIKTRFADVLGNEEAILAAVTLTKFKLRWLRSQELKDKFKASLLAECRRIVLEEPQQGNSTSTQQHHTDSAKENDLFSFEEDEEETTSLAENQVADYIRSSAQNIDSLCGFSLIKKISLRYNAATPSSAPVERLFSLGKLVFSPKRNRLSDQKFEKLLLLRYNHWLTC
ncbi:zinc finger BED domain-containing protein 4-like [Rana temporaria]|uniref:zinc finger BED domain-containing protein 4-like n=1 Tax=Rana temporaria TaxID=8407 RepID=UPI001AADE10C|nr:zinc finger BED domain-containing protein 4-like [Rana temporaria]